MMRPRQPPKKAPRQPPKPEKKAPGRPRKRAGEADVDHRYAEAHRLEAIRDEAAAAAQTSNTIASKAAWLAAEQQVAAAWASALRADGKIGPAMKYAELAVKFAAAHAKAVEQLIGDRVEQLHQLAVRRSAAADLLEHELATAGAAGGG